MSGVWMHHIIKISIGFNLFDAATLWAHLQYVENKRERRQFSFDSVATAAAEGLKFIFLKMKSNICLFSGGTHPFPTFY